MRFINNIKTATHNLKSYAALHFPKLHLENAVYRSEDIPKINGFRK